MGCARSPARVQARCSSGVSAPPSIDHRNVGLLLHLLHHQLSAVEIADDALRSEVRQSRSAPPLSLPGLTMACMLQRISRRRFVDGTVRLALFTPLIHLEPLTAAGRALFPAVDRQTLRAAADVIIPAHRQMPAASAVGAVTYIARIAAADRTLGDLLSDGLRAIAAHAGAAQGIRFDQLAIERQTEVLARVETTNTPANFFGTLRDLVYEAYYTQPRVQKLIRYNFRSGSRRTAPVVPLDEQLVARVRRQKPIYRQVS